jgi:hypothetical protein
MRPKCTIMIRIQYAGAAVSSAEAARSGRVDQARAEAAFFAPRSASASTLNSRTTRRTAASEQSAGLSDPPGILHENCAILGRLRHPLVTDYVGN